MQASKIKKYYIGFGVLMLLTFALLFYTIALGSKAKVDAKTDKALSNISQKLDSFIYDKNKIPNSLAEAGAKDVPASIIYTKESSTTYKFCVNYQNASSGFDGGWTWLLFGGFMGSGAYMDDYYSDNNEEKSYLDIYSLQYSHKKGQNCQTVKPYIDSYNSSPGLSPPSTGIIDYCDPSRNTQYAVKVKATVSSIDDNNGNGTMYFESTGQTATDSNDKALNNSGVITSKKYDGLSYFCDNTNTKTSASNVKAGQKIIIYLNAISDSYIGKADI